MEMAFPSLSLSQIKAGVQSKNKVQKEKERKKLRKMARQEGRCKAEVDGVAKTW
jgi:hypothetical protein